jgi:ABC-2 type transport system ATP-binding protein
MPADERAITVRGLVKRYDGRAVVDDLSFDVARGEIFALLGPNGAGKTTTVEILEGYRFPDAGVVRVLGLSPVADAAALKPRIGLMLQDGGVYPAIRPPEALRLFASFYPNPADPLELLRLVELDDAVGTRYRQLSGGQKQRLSLALALVGRPELVFLDEPTAAMDPRARHATWDIILGLKAAGVTILLTTHFMDEAERLADRVAIVVRGRLRALDTPEALGRQSGPERIRFTAPAGLPLDGLSAVLGARLALEERPGEYLVDVEPTPARVARLAAWLAERDVLVSELRVGRRSLEDVFLRLTARTRAIHGGGERGARGE